MKTSYLKHWDNQGTCYNQTIRLDKSIIETVNAKIELTLKTIAQKTVINSEELKLQSYLKPIHLGMNYSTHTLRDFILIGVLGITSFKDRNTVFNVK